MQTPSIEISSTQLEAAVVNCLERALADALAEKIEGRKNWTGVFKRALAQLGRDYFGCRICTSGIENCEEGEWLYDMVWYKYRWDGPERFLGSVPFVMECEWNLQQEEIKDDFEKLLLANADLALMICWVHADYQSALKEYFRNSVQNYKQGRSGSRVLIAVLDYTTDKFKWVAEIRP